MQNRAGSIRLSHNRYALAHEYGNLIYQIWKTKSNTAQSSWHLDATYINVKGKWCYLYHTMDADGRTLDFQLRQTCDHQAAYAFMRRLVKHFWRTNISNNR